MGGRLRRYITKIQKKITMADCGANGSALDRVVSAAMGGAGRTNNNKGLEHILTSSLLGVSNSTRTTQHFAGPSSLGPLVAPATSTYTTSAATATASNSSLASKPSSSTIQTNVQQPNTTRTASLQFPQQHQQLIQLANANYTLPPRILPPQPHHFLVQQQMQYQQQQMHMMHIHMQQQQQLRIQQQQQQQELKNQNFMLETVWKECNSTTRPPTQKEEDAQLFDDNYEQYYENYVTNNETVDDDLIYDHTVATSIDQLAQAWKNSEFDILDTPTVPQYVYGEQSHLLLERWHTTTTTATLSSTASNDFFMLEGTRQFQNGNIPQAIACFEAELLNSTNATTTTTTQAWTMLGKCHAENDQDKQAIACFEKAIQIDPYCLDALLLLGVSYVNECNNMRALRTLQAWVQNNPTYATMEEPMFNEDSSTMITPLNQVKDLLQRALDLVKNNVHDDPMEASRVHEALGVCCNVSQEYEAAALHFETAIELCNNHHKSHTGSTTNGEATSSMCYGLWNKLGATLANGNISSERALECYVKSLKDRPKYARAWLNMAISHSNLRQYEEAARCYLQTLSLNPNAIHCWNYLRIALTCLERYDLLPLASGQKLEAFREHFDFVLYE